MAGVHCSSIPTKLCTFCYVYMPLLPISIFIDCIAWTANAFFIDQRIKRWNSYHYVVDFLSEKVNQIFQQPHRELNFKFSPENFSKCERNNFYLCLQYRLYAKKWLQLNLSRESTENIWKALLKRVHEIRYSTKRRRITLTYTHTPVIPCVYRIQMDSN